MALYQQRMKRKEAIVLPCTNELLVKNQLELEQLNQKYIELYDLSPICYLTLDESGLIVDANQSSADLLGLNKSAVKHKNFSRYIAANYQDIFYQHINSVITNMALEICKIKLFKRKDSLFYAQLNSKTIINTVTSQKQILIFISDITGSNNSKKISKNIPDLDKTLSMSELTNKIAHDINQPISAIYNYLHGCIRRLESGDFEVDQILGALNKAANQSHRTNEIILRMKNFSCKNILCLEAICINQLIHEAISLVICEMTDYPVEISYREINYHSSIVLDRVHIQQVILSLLRNSIEAMRDELIRNPKIIIETNILNPSEIEIMVMDNGPGILPENIHKLYDPHFTTKSYGIGLGLAVSRYIVEAHEGVLSLSSEPNQGTCAKIILPLRVSCLPDP